MDSFAYYRQGYFIMARTKDFDEDEVLAKAIQLFWHKGYNGTSMQDLVQALGISRSSLYDTYTDKHALFVKALKSYQCTGTANIRAILDGGGTAKETIQKLLEFTIDDLLNDRQQKGCFMVNAEVEVAPHDAEVNRLICENEHQMEEAFYFVVQEGQENGELKKEHDARAMSRFIFNTFKGMRVTAKSTSDKAYFDDIIRLTIAALD